MSIGLRGEDGVLEHARKQMLRERLLLGVRQRLALADATDAERGELARDESLLCITSLAAPASMNSAHALMKSSPVTSIASS